MPDFAVTTAKNLSNLTAPLSMLVIGASFLDFKIIDLFTDTKLLLFSGIKMLLIPMAGTWIIKQFVDDPMILGVCMVMLATPVGSMTAMLAQQCLHSNMMEIMIWRQEELRLRQFLLW